MPTPRSKGQLRDGFRYVARTPELGIPLLMMGLVGMLAYEFQVTLPYAAKHVFHGDSQTFGLMTSAMGIGAIARRADHRRDRQDRHAPDGAVGLRLRRRALPRRDRADPAARAGRARAPSASPRVTFLAMGNSTLQLATEPQMRGRVMALWAVAFLGSTPIGGPLIGWITAIWGARVGLGVGALSCFVAAGLGLLAIRRLAPGSPAVAGSKLQTSSRTA